MVVSVGNRTLSGQGLSRVDKKVKNNLGTIKGDDLSAKFSKFRSEKLELFDKYLEGTQYDKLVPWEQGNCREEYIPIRQRKPRVIINFAKRFASTLATHLVGSEVFPDLFVEDLPDETEFVNLMVKFSKIKKVLPGAMRHMAISGSVLIRFRFEESGAPILEVYNAKYCYPELDSSGNLTFCRIRYTYIDRDDRDEHGKPKEKWFQLDLDRGMDTLYDNPEYKAGEQPTFEVVEEVPHELGFVQAEWFRTTEIHNKVDGESILDANVLSLIDEINYSVSQSSQAISYNQEPQVIIKGMDEDEIDCLTKTSQKAWNLGRDGDASFLESGLGAVEVAQAGRDKIRLAMQDVTRVVLQDPDKMTANAQSGKALEQLNKPLVDLVNEIRPTLEDRLRALLVKISATTLMLIQKGQPVAVTLPDGFIPQSLEIVFKWPSVFPQTIADLMEKARLAQTLTSANLVSRETMLRWLAADFNIENIEEELQKVNTQQQFNTFGF